MQGKATLKVTPDTYVYSYTTGSLMYVYQNKTLQYFKRPPEI